jgi:hypothetical protein
MKAVKLNEKSKKKQKKLKKKSQHSESEVWKFIDVYCNWHVSSLGNH